MKLTPLLLFFLLLVVLVIAVITLKNPITPVEKEGFVQFKANVVPQQETVVPPYSSRPIVKIYDNLFIDRKNINIVEVVSSEFIGNIDAKYVVTKGNVDLTGSTIISLNVQTRDGTITKKAVTKTDVIESDESKISSITSSYKSIPFYSSITATTGKYQLFYIPWNTDTYIHGIQTMATPSNKSSFKPLNLFSYRIPSDTSSSMNAVYYTDNQINLTTATADTSTNNNKYVIEPLYSKTEKVFQLSSDVKFHLKTSNLIVNNGTSIIVYDRSGTPKTYTSPPPSSDLKKKIDSTQTTSWIKNNGNNTTQILYFPYNKNTLVMLMQIDEGGRFKMINVGRFSKYYVDDGDTNPDDNDGEGDDDDTNNPVDPGKIPLPPGIGGSAISDYYKWYWYWNSAGAGTNPAYSNNYLLKTQIVPPVCPSCPSTTCASTTSTTTGSSSTKTDASGNIISDTVTSTSNVLGKTVDTAGNVVNKTLDTAGNILNKTVDTTSNLLTSGATGASNLLTSGATGATNLLTSGVSGATDLAKSTVSGTVDLAKDAGSGLLKFGDKALDKTGNVIGGLTQPGYGGGNTGGYAGGYGSGYSAPGFSRGSPPIDNYSYYGALPRPGSNYIPITADFSAFSK